MKRSSAPRAPDAPASTPAATGAARVPSSRRRRPRVFDHAATDVVPLAALTLTVATVTSLVFLAAATLLSGCAATTTPVLDRNFGDASRALMAQQVMDPNAPSRHAAQGAKLDGRLVREGGARVVDAYKAPPPNNIINVGVGAGGSDR